MSFCDEVSMASFSFISFRSVPALLRRLSTDSLCACRPVNGSNNSSI